ncbi:hypothetical protein X757_18180 [Mesorhizobium sp. LSHC414A00]|nr:hypothetical protein X757_18180 [Mesorhizobium sp. LSHC414A00]
MSTLPRTLLHVPIKPASGGLRMPDRKVARSRRNSPRSKVCWFLGELSLKPAIWSRYAMKSLWSSRSALPA